MIDKILELYFKFKYKFILKVIKISIKTKYKYNTTKNYNDEKSKYVVVSNSKMEENVMGLLIGKLL